MIAFADRARLVAGAADALQAAGDRRRRLDLHDEIDGAHVDAELERRGGDERLDAAGLEQILDLAARLARQRAVMRAHQRLAGQLVERAGQPLGEPPAVDEEQRRLVRANQLEQPRVNRRPDRRRAPAAAPPGRSAPRPARPRRAMSSTGTSMRSSSCFLSEASTMVTGRNSRGACASSRTRRAARLRLPSSGDRASALGALRPPCARLRRGSRARRRRGSAPLRRADAAWPRGRCAAAAAGRPRARAQRLQPLERQRQVRAALAGHERVDLVDDHRVDRRQPLARVRREQQEQRLGRGDQDVGRRRAGTARARSPACRRCGWRSPAWSTATPARRGDVGDAGERRAQVALDVHGQRLERRDVEHAAALPCASAPARTSAG